MKKRLARIVKALYILSMGSTPTAQENAMTQELEDQLARQGFSQTAETVSRMAVKAPNLTHHHTILLAYFAEIMDIEGDSWEAWTERNRVLGKCQNTIDAALKEVLRAEEASL